MCSSSIFFPNAEKLLYSSLHEERIRRRGEKISYIKFPQEKHLFDEWIRAIRRDVGRHFKVTDNTRVCSRHFKDGDFEVSLTGRRTLRDGAVPSRFEWKTASPKKRKSPAKSRSNIQFIDPDSDSVEPAGQSSNHLEDVTGPESEETSAFETELNELKTRVEDLTERCTNSEREVFCFSRFYNDSNSFQFYTGFPDVKLFDALYEFCNPGEHGENISYWHSATTSEGSTSSDSSTKQGRPRILHPKEELFITLCRLRQGFPEEHLAHLYGVSQSTISRIIVTWVNFLYLELKDVPMWPSRELVDKYMPEQFKEKFPSTRVIIDCTEIKCQMPRRLLLNSELFSSYKNNATLKCLVGITPGGAISFVSQLYTGHITDR